jgi:cell division inhibitor SepF
MVSKSMGDAGRVHVVAPLRFADAKEIGDIIRQSNPVIVNLQGADRDLQRRMIDFCSGIAYVIGCSMERVAEQVFLLTPEEVTVSPEERARLERRGFNRDD